jgi:hypothetical protein
MYVDGAPEGFSVNALTVLSLVATTRNGKYGVPWPVMNSETVSADSPDTVEPYI